MNNRRGRRGEVEGDSGFGAWMTGHPETFSPCLPPFSSIPSGSAPSNRPQFIHRRNLSAPWSPLSCGSFLIHKSGQTSSFPQKSVVGSTRLICRKHFGHWPRHKKPWRNGDRGHYCQHQHHVLPSLLPGRAPLYPTGLLLWAHARSCLSHLHFSGIFKTPTFLPWKNFLP